MKSINEKGEYAIYDQGQLKGYEPVVIIHGVKVLAKLKDKLEGIINAARKDGIILTLAAGFRTWDEQFQLRKQNVILKDKATDENYLIEESSDKFNPRTGKPGWSNHQDGGAYDFNVTGLPRVYKWLCDNAHKHGFIRTVQSERWHWEYLPGQGQFSHIQKTDPTWDGNV